MSKVNDPSSISGLAQEFDLITRRVQFRWSEELLTLGRRRHQGIATLGFVEP